jgi:hypothetical protein
MGISFDTSSGRWGVGDMRMLPDLEASGHVVLKKVRDVIPSQYSSNPRKNPNPTIVTVSLNDVGLKLRISWVIPQTRK